MRLLLILIEYRFIHSFLTELMSFDYNIIIALILLLQLFYFVNVQIIKQWIKTAILILHISLIVHAVKLIMQFREQLKKVYL